MLGVDDEGRSCVVSERPVSAAAIPSIPGTAAASLFKTEQSPPPPCAPGQGTVVPSDLAPGVVHWYVVEHEPPTSREDHAGTELHRRDSIDLVIVLDGSAELLLGDGTHPVHERDCIVMAGVDHGLRPGPEGCRLMSFAIGTPPASRADSADDSDART